MKKFFLLFSLMVVSLAVVSCGSDEDEPNYANQTMVAGDTYTIPGKIKDWTSDNDLIASVSNGIVTAERVGETYIRSGAKFLFKSALYLHNKMFFHANRSGSHFFAFRGEN